MNEEMMKSLVDLIDESLAEIDELKKSDRFSASECKMGDSDSGMEGRDKNGSMGKDEDAEKADDDSDDKDKDDDKEDKDKDDKDMDKADGKNSESDPNAGHHQAAKGEDGMDKGEMMAGDSDKGSSTGGSAGQNRQADPNGGHHMAKSEDAEEETEKVDISGELKKSREESETLIKSYIDEKVGGLEAKLAGIADMVKEIADAPVPARGASYKDVTPLQKSEEEAGETLSKAAVADKLFELKKSGESVDSQDIASVELGSPGELSRIVNKYNIK